VTAALGLIAATAAPALAQTTAGVEGGFSLYRISPGETITRGPGFLAGVYVQKPLFATIGLQLELIYAQKSTHLGPSEDLNVSYVQVPILAKLKLIKALYLTEGVAVSWPVRGHTDFSGSVHDVKAELKSPDLGLVIGGGLPIRRGAVEFRYEGSFKTTFADEFAFQRGRTLSLIARAHF
jgi:outer membrane protein with beta-barrel domain